MPGKNFRLVLLAAVACSVFLYNHLTVSRGAGKVNVKISGESTSSPANTTVEKLFQAWDYSEQASHEEDVSKSGEIGEETGPRTSPTSTSIRLEIQSEKANEERPPRPLPSQTTPKYVEFPSVSNCTENHPLGKRGDIYDNNNAYPCKHHPIIDHTNPYWPVSLAPSYGKILMQISKESRHHNEEVQDLLEEQLKVQKARLARLGFTCEAHPELSTRQHLTLVWDTSRKPALIYCPIYKAASTTWMTYFLRLKHINVEDPSRSRKYNKQKKKVRTPPPAGGGHQHAFREFPEPKGGRQKQRLFMDSLRFLVVRHPFARILSAYRDKIERPKPRPFMPYFQHLQRAIISRFRPRGTNATLSPQPTFAEFVEYLIYSTEKLATAEDWRHNVVCWLPYWVQCAVCSSDYQVVIKLETMTTDEQFLAHVADLKEIQNVQEWRNKHGSPAAAVIPQYFKTLTRHQVQMLYQRYKLDFDLFGYSVKEYLAIARPG